MQPTSPLGQISQSMAQGQPELNQISSSSPAGDPSLQPPPQPPMPNKFDLIHKAAARRGMNVQSHPQLQAQPTQAPSQPMQPQQPEIPVSEAELIIKALTKRLEHHGKVTEKLIDSFLPKTNESKTQV